MVVGSVELLPLTDAVGILGGLDELYPGVSAAAWKPYRELYPELFAGDTWRVPCSCYLVRAGSRTVLVDTGVGPPGLWDWEPEWEGGLLPALAAHGVDPADVDVVVLTHVHIDHVGWNADRDGTLLFPRARFAMHPDAVEWARFRAGRPHIRRCLLPLVDGALVDELVDGAEVAPGVVVTSLPGHDPGHIGLRIGADAVLIADAAVHPALLAEPDWPYESDMDGGRAARTRREFVAEACDADVLVVSGHYPGTGIGRVITRDGRVVWQQVGE